MLKKIIVALIFNFFLILSGCGSAKLFPLDKDNVILAFGDSLTAGVGTTKENSYPNKLAKLSGFKVINSGVSGETTSEGLLRLPTVIKEHKPDLIILIEGGNDIIRNQNYDQIKRNLEAMINIALNSGIQVVLVGVPEKKLLSNSAPFYTELAEKYDLAIDSKLIGKLLRDASKKSDPIHFNKEGYADLAKGIYELLSKNGAFD